MSVQLGLLDTVLENIIQGVVMFDPDRRLRVWNHHYQAILKFPDGFLKRGLSNFDMAFFLASQGAFGPGDPAALASNRLDVIWGEKETRTSITIDDRVYEVLCKRTEDGGLVITYTDVTERERTRARLASLNAHKDKFFMLVAHDLRGPFNALLGYSELMQIRSGSLDRDQVRDFSGQIHRAAADAYKLLEDLLDWSSLQLGGYRIDRQPIDLAVLVTANLLRYQAIAESKGLEICQTGLDRLVVWADCNMIDTVLRNLISNAIKFSRPGGRIEIKLHEAAGTAGISVSDQGVGIAPDKLDQLFEFGSEGRTKGTEGEVGTGLGLHLCREMLDMLDGSIDVQSRPGEGSTFRIILPMAEQTAL